MAIDCETDGEPVQKGQTNTQNVTYRQKLPTDRKNKRFSLKVFNSRVNYPKSEHLVPWD